MAEENPFARLFNAAPAAGTIATLAQLAPGSSTDNVEIKLIASNPKTATYHCISYDRSREWEKKNVIVDGQPIPIPLPLEQALRCFRHPTEPVLLWADLLTGDRPQERSKQALVTKEVVENALAVTCFLGAGSELSTKAYAVLQTVANWWSQAALSADFPSRLSQATHRNIEDVRASLRSRNLSDIQLSDHRLWQEIEHTLSSPYFKSTGALADVILGKQVLIRSGTASISWDNLNKASRGLLFVLPMTGRGVSEKIAKGFELVGGIDVSVQRKKTGDTLELLPMINSASRETVTADPREFVFAVLPVVTPSLRTTAMGRQPEHLPTTDYAKPVDQVFIEAAKYIIGDRQDLLLWWSEKPPCRKKIQSLPSWVPDWSASNPRPPIRLDPVSGLRKWWDSISSPKRIFVDSDHALHVQAHALDQVDYVSPTFTKDNFRRLCHNAWKHAKFIPGVTKMEAAENFWRAVVLDTDQGFGERIRDNVKPGGQMALSWQSLICEEMILEKLGCMMQELATTPSLQARARADETGAALGSLTGQSAPIEELITRNSLGRRLFQCRSGRVGMTSIERGASQSHVSDDGGTSEPHFGFASGPDTDFDGALRSMLQTTIVNSFQAYVAERDPAAAEAFSEIFQDMLPQGQSSQGLPVQVVSGVRSGDIVAALVGGFQPYILRSFQSEVGGSELRADSKYTFVGDCHLQGAMDGECLLDPNETHGKWKRVPLVDVVIV
jgi:hypothetical protein